MCFDNKLLLFSNSDGKIREYNIVSRQFSFYISNLFKNRRREKANAFGVVKGKRTGMREQKEREKLLKHEPKLGKRFHSCFEFRFQKLSHLDSQTHKSSQTFVRCSTDN